MGVYCVRVLKPMARVDPGVMMGLAILSVVLVIFAMVPLFSASDQTSDIINVSWASTEKGFGDAFYIGVYKFAYVEGSTEKSFKWDSVSCNYVEELYGDHFCNECENGQNFIIGFTAVFFVFSVFSAIAAVLRWKKVSGLGGDIVCQQMLVACNIVTFIFGVTAVAVFNTTCRRYWPFSGHDYETGPAAAIIIFVVSVKIVEAAIHWLVTDEPLDHHATNVGPL
jgi:hypothetical protein